jgi:alpha-tubulin suppressor-like RCC1 family protein
VRTDGRVLCWGRNFQGQLGFEGPNAMIPTLVPGTGYAAITAGGNHTCTVDVSGSAWCWGDNESGQLGDGTLANRSEPTRVSGGHTWVTVSTGTNHTFGLTASGTAYCWGSGAEGQLGTGGTPSLRPAPTEVPGGHVFTRISAGGYHTCGVTNGNVALCWGANNWAQLGDGSLTSRLSPTAVAGGLKFLEITAAYDHSCGIVAGGWAFCWGLNTYGQLGEGGVVNFSTKPIGVFPPDALSAIVATPGTSTRVGVRGRPHPGL